MGNQTLRIIFFGSTADSVLVLEKLYHVSGVMCQAVVTQPPRPVGRKQQLTPTPVELWAKEHSITILSFPSNLKKPWLYENESQVIDALEPLKADLVISACYGQKIPWESIAAARFGGLNVHPSLLPRWRGADPVPWAILNGDRQTGVTVVTLSEKFDDGAIIAQKKVPITDTDTSDALRTKLFTIGSELLIQSLDSVIARSVATKQSHKRLPRPPSTAGLAKTPSSYARRLTRDDGFDPWESFLKAFKDEEEARRIERKFRAFSPWPGVWTTLKVKSEQKRLKILALHLSPITYHLSLDAVQLEGKKPVSWKQFDQAYPLFPT
ncbi:methionyl-tRNA formyltransferase [Candidatus Gottesmanbacteria bacterium]|nr:methionyl-tRNA formyltransferase [Candidatus Gottesmanbacteria bacterium]